MDRPNDCAHGRLIYRDNALPACYEWAGSHYPEARMSRNRVLWPVFCLVLFAADASAQIYRYQILFGQQDVVGQLDSGRLPLVATTARPLEIDVAPVRASNVVLPGSPERIPVAILGSENLDVRDTDERSLRFGPSEAGPAPWRGREVARRHDIDHVGDLDLLARFAVHDTGIALGDEVACLSAQTFTGETLDTATRFGRPRTARQARLGSRAQALPTPPARRLPPSRGSRRRAPLRSRSPSGAASRRRASRSCRTRNR